MDDEPSGIFDDNPDPDRHAPLPPEDRIWRHPSELAIDALTSPTRGQGSGWGYAALGAASGALAVSAAWFAIGGTETVRLATERVALVPTETVAPLVVAADDWGRVVAHQARRGTVTVRLVDDTAPIAGAVAYRDDGYLITSARALGSSDTVRLELGGGSRTDAEVVGVDRVTDIGVLRVDRDLAAAIVADSGALQAGDRLAIVDPDGGSVEVSVTDPSTIRATIDGDRVIGVTGLDSDLGTTPPGSPVVDHTGAVVGVSTATDPEATAALVPIDVARAVATDLIELGYAHHPWLGITARDLESLEARDRPAGALVTVLEPGGPAAAGGIEEGDVITEIAGQPIDSMASMVAEIRRHEPGETLVVLVDRDGARVGCVVVLGELNDGA
ncbi:MAG: S1C family serine protease [Acidimicrobiales bacterium]